GADREADGSGADTGGPQLFVVQLTMRRAGRMNDEALRIADVCKVRPQRYTTDEILSRGAATAAVEGEHRTGAARQILVDQRTVAARRQARVRHVRGKFVRGQITGHREGVLDVA